MFRRISVLLALQFTAFVALLLLINGILFIAADFRFSGQLLSDGLLRTSNRVITRLQAVPDGMSVNLLPHERDVIRVVDGRGEIIYSGAAFEDIPFDPRVPEFSDVVFEDSRMRVMTSPILRAGTLMGFLQVGRMVDLPSDQLQRRVWLLLFTTAVISLVTFFIGLFFAKRSLKPAEESMQRLEQFTQDASHELRTPLAVLRSSLDLALKTKKYEEGIASAKEDVTRITLLTERLLELARLDRLALQKERVDFSGLIARTAEGMASMAEKKGVSLKQEVQPGVFVSGDPTLLRQMLENLIGNALKFTPQDGDVTVSLRGNQLTVADTGMGISPEDTKRIFDRFFQSDSAHSTGGFGLGLALVKRIVDLHDWSISVKSDAGKGAQFTVAYTPLS